VSSLRLSIRLYSQRRNPQSPFPYPRTDRKRSLLIGRDLKCVAFAVMMTTTRACGSHLAHFTGSPKSRHRRTGRLEAIPRGKFQAQSHDRQRGASFRDHSRVSYLLSITMTANRIGMFRHRRTIHQIQYA